MSPAVLVLGAVIVLAHLGEQLARRQGDELRAEIARRQREAVENQNQEVKP